MTLAAIVFLAITGAGVIGSHSWIARYWWRTRGDWRRTEHGRYMWTQGAGWAVLFDVSFLNAALGAYWGMEAVIIASYAVLVVVATLWPHRLLTISNRNADPKEVTTMDRTDSIWWRIVNLDPALFRAAVVAVFALASSVGIVVVPALPDALVLAVLAVAALVQGVWTRKGVTANARVVVYAPDPVRRPGRVLAGDATTRASDRLIIGAARTDPTGRPSTVSGQD